jgi:hypothetical protein
MLAVTVVLLLLKRLTSVASTPTSPECDCESGSSHKTRPAENQQKAARLRVQVDDLMVGQRPRLGDGTR